MDSEVACSQRSRGGTASRAHPRREPEPAVASVSVLPAVSVPSPSLEEVLVELDRVGRELDASSARCAELEAELRRVKAAARRKVAPTKTRKVSGKAKVVPAPKAAAKKPTLGAGEGQAPGDEAKALLGQPVAAGRPPRNGRARPASRCRSSRARAHRRRSTAPSLDARARRPCRRRPRQKRTSTSVGGAAGLTVHSSTIRFGGS